MTNHPESAKWDFWIEYFKHNAANLLDIKWDNSYRLTIEETRTIEYSLAQFQLGESSEGNHVLSLAQAYTESSGDTNYISALRLFIKEEQRHAQYLARFMQQQGLRLAASHPVDSVFRLLRHTFNLKLSVMAMMTAEIIAVPYYKALHDTTNSPMLHQICVQLLRDEMQHLQFQRETLRQLNQQRSFGNLVVNHFTHYILFAATLLVVWQQHHPVLRAGGYTFQKFCLVNYQRFNRLFAVPREVCPETAL